MKLVIQIIRNLIKKYRLIGIFIHFQESEVRQAAALSLATLCSFCDDSDRLSSLQASVIDIIIDDSIPIQTGLLTLSVISQISFKVLHLQFSLVFY